MLVNRRSYCECGKKLASASGNIFTCSHQFAYCNTCAVFHDLHCPKCKEQLQKTPVGCRAIRAIPLYDVEEILFYDNKGKITGKLKFNY